MHTLRPILLALGCAVTAAVAQTPPRFDVTATHALYDHTGHQPLPGTALAPGGLVQILSAGADGAPAWPDAAGQPAGDDLVLFETRIGIGIPPEQPLSGRFSASSALTLPQPGEVLFARVFDGATSGASAYWGQTLHTFSYQALAVMDISGLGLDGLTFPTGSDPATTDSDGDGQTDAHEWQAGTSPLDPSDTLAAILIVDWVERVLFDAQPTVFPVFSPASPPVRVPQLGMEVLGRTGRRYTLESNLDGLGSPGSWSPILTHGPLQGDAPVQLSDPDPPIADKAFYRIHVDTP